MPEAGSVGSCDCCGDDVDGCDQEVLPFGKPLGGNKVHPQMLAGSVGCLEARAVPGPGDSAGMTRGPELQHDELALLSVGGVCQWDLPRPLSVIVSST